MRDLPHRIVQLLLAVCILLIPAGADRAASGQPLARVTPGTWLSVKGEFGQGGVFLAREVQATDDRSRTIKGPLDGFDPESRELRFGPLRLALDDRTRLQSDDGRPVSPHDLAPGRRVKIDLALEDGGRLRVRRVRLLSSPSGSLRMEGPVESSPRRNSEGTRFMLLGVNVQIHPRTSWRGVSAPLLPVAEKDQRPRRGQPMGKFGTLYGELRFDLKARSNFDLADQLDADLSTGRLRARIGWKSPSTSKVEGMIQIKAQNEESIQDEAEDFEGRSGVRLGRAYALFSGVLTQRGSAQVGRSRLEDDRDWLFHRDLDAIRLFLDTARWHLEASVSEELVDPILRHQDIRNTLFFVSFYPGGKNVVSAYLFDRDDRFREPAGALRDFSPRHVGVQARRKGKRLQYWLEAALARGSIREEPLDGHAFDAGFTLVAPGAGEPSLTLGYAFATGDEDPLDGVNRTFRQTGLQLNNGKWNGVTNFRYYGELLRPELANLRIETAGLGFRPRRKTSIDLVYHRYRLDKPASELVRDSLEDAQLNLLDVDIGEEWDLVLGLEELRHVEFEVNISAFLPGDAFVGPGDTAYMLRVKTKFVF